MMVPRIITLVISFGLALISSANAQSKAKPLRIMLITGGCCHNYAAQKGILKEGLEARIPCSVEQIHVDDGSTKPPLPIFGNKDYAAGFDLVIHDECAADISDPAIVKDVIHPHAQGLPAVCLHCAMHSYRVGDFRAKVDQLGEARTAWFELLGLQSTGHGPQQPIAISYTQRNHPIVKGLKDWTTINEELYNNVSILKTATPLATGKQGNQETVVAWTNTFGPKKTRIFATTIGHNNETVADARYLDLVAKGVLWATNKLDSQGRPLPGYSRPKP